MIIEYDVLCFERTLTIKFPDGYEHLKEEILKMLDGYYDEWMHVGEIEDSEKRDLVDSTCLEEYMVFRLSEIYNMWTEWESIPYGDDYEPRKTLWVCEHCLMAIESREGNQARLAHSVDETDAVDSKCGWCGERGHSVLYELI